MWVILGKRKGSGPAITQLFFDPWGCSETGGRFAGKALNGVPLARNLVVIHSHAEGAQAQMANTSLDVSANLTGIEHLK
jgi:hypothetical protein